MSKDKPTGYSPKEWEEIIKGLEVAKTPDGEEVTYTEYKKREQENTKENTNDKKSYYVTEIIYDNPLLNEISEKLAKSKSDIKSLLTEAFNLVPSSNQSDPVESDHVDVVCTMPMGNIDDMSEG